MLRSLIFGGVRDVAMLQIRSLYNPERPIRPLNRVQEISFGGQGEFVIPPIPMNPLR